MRFRIVGVQVHKGSNGFQDQDDFMFAPITTVIDNIVGNVDSYTIIAARAVNKDMLPPAMGEIHHDPRQTHGLKPGDPPDFIVFNAAALLAAGKAAGQAVPVAARGGGGHLAAHRRHRGHEHHAGDRHRADTRRSASARRSAPSGSDIVTQFLAEAMLLASLGGLIGVGVGVGLGSLKSATMQPIVSPWSVVMSFGVSVLIGIFFGAYPASRAAALTPMEALRYE